jgi:hypothetical protein
MNKRNNGGVTMRNLEVALCDCCEDYILKFASYLMSNVDASIHIFTTTESFFSDEGCYDVAIMSEDFKEVSEFRPKGEVKRKYFLCEEPDVEDDDYIYRTIIFYKTVKAIDYNGNIVEVEPKNEYNSYPDKLPKKNSLWKKVLGGVTMGVGIIAAPFTFFSSLGLTAIGAGMISSLRKIVYNKINKNEYH